jgi:hypothetical protein
MSETLSFSRRTGRVIVGMHPHASMQPRPGGSLRALAYTGHTWACLPGKSGGNYLMVVLARPPRSNCTDCEYARLYDLNGRLIAAELAFDAHGAPRRDVQGRSTIRALLENPEASAYRAIYR